MELSLRIFLMGLLVAGCSKPAPQTGETITDEVGRTLQVTIPAKRIVSMAPSITEILFAIGAGKQVVGVTDFCNFPAGADSLPTIGGLTTPSAEQLLLLTPDLVVATADGNPRQLADRLGNAGVPFYTTHPVSIVSLYDGISRLGYLTGHVREADSLIASMISIIGKQPDRVQPPTAFVVIGTDPLMSVSSGSYLDDVLMLSGLKNHSAGLAVRYPVINPESLILNPPDYILIPTGSTTMPDPHLPESILQLNRPVIRVDADSFYRPGPRLATVIADIRRQVRL
ncbi:MAG: ABC transporter substrate-binding protein [Bacteroidetes bacterium]|nr:ABC transporter substrate-binding protein [Bacteroidota bacterium]